uniref:Zinc finger, CCHC-type n=1 Tax=Tanacetum cinerariifolium TaxID=118510 RepID=A0A6L2P3W5_TANCI|nr:zinc finger, CCHC-type [Tanacetum cinerariifolium]
MDIAMDEPLGLGYEALRRHELALGDGSIPSQFEIGQSSRSMSEQQRLKETPAPRPPVYATLVDPVDGTIYTKIPIFVPPVRVHVWTPPSPEWSSGSLPVSPVPTPVASTATTPAATIAVDKCEFLETPDQDLVRRDLKKNYRTVDTVEKPTVAIYPDLLLLGKLESRTLRTKSLEESIETSLERLNQSRRLIFSNFVWYDLVTCAMKLYRRISCFCRCRGVTCSLIGSCSSNDASGMYSSKGAEPGSLIKGGWSCLMQKKVNKETTVAGIWTKLTSLYMTKSLVNRLYLKKKLCTYYMSLGTKLGYHIDDFNKLIHDLANVDIEIEDEDHALMLLTSFSSSYENFVETLLYGRESLTMKDVLATLNSRKLKKIGKGKKKEIGDGLYVRGMSDHSGKAHASRSSRFKSMGGTGKLKCFICHSDDHLKRDCPMKKSSGFVKKVGNEEMTEFIMDSDGSYHMKHGRDFLYEFKVVDGISIQLELRRSLISLDTLEKEGYTVKMQMCRIKVIKGCRVIMTGIRKKNCVYTVKAKVMTFGKKTPWYKGGAKIMVTGVPVQEGAKGNVAEKNKENNNFFVGRSQVKELSKSLSKGTTWVVDHSKSLSQKYLQIIWRYNDPIWIM